MEIVSSEAKKYWTKVLNDSQNEHVIIKHYKERYSVIISWSEYQKLIESDVRIATDVQMDGSSLILRWEYKGEASEIFNIEYSKQAYRFIIDHNIETEQYEHIVNAVCDRGTLDDIAGTDLYIKEADRLVVIYKLSGSNIVLVHIHKSNHAPDETHKNSKIRKQK